MSEKGSINLDYQKEIPVAKRAWWDVDVIFIFTSLTVIVLFGGVVVWAALWLLGLITPAPRR